MSLAACSKEEIPEAPKPEQEQTGKPEDKPVIDEKHPNFTGLDKMAREMCILLKPIVDKYEINDDFSGTVEYDYLRKELDEHITIYIRKTGLDQF